ncbi:MAG: ankyrin repeat domain-containing protein 50 [Faunusvirus sp.]|jgi:hypothetical protein|uniref:Ankyrin repeat domain-containing protein 50 n=1 Tax=Faunusvirus sp. TaxID=2487766 RepID=A0A3G4ZWA5_9VIRU|nr:MAG: ankyrin repeat domain-containing protein 50 [Faunusvirus sp.]
MSLSPDKQLALFRDAVELCDEGSCCYIIEKYHDFYNMTDKHYNQTPIIFAATNNLPNIVSLLITKKVDLNHQDKNGLTALMYVAHHTQIKQIYELTENGADAELKDSTGKTFIEHIKEEWHNIYSGTMSQKTDELIKYGATNKYIDILKNSYFEYLSTDSVWNIFYNTEEALINSGIIYKPAYFEHVIHSDENMQLLYLEKCDVSINAQSADGSTLLIHACMVDYTKIIDVLLNKHANVNIMDNIGLTALYYAVSYYLQEVAIKLIKHGAKQFEYNIKYTDGGAITRNIFDYIDENHLSDLRMYLTGEYYNIIMHEINHEKGPLNNAFYNNGASVIPKLICSFI